MLKRLMAILLLAGLAVLPRSAIGDSTGVQSTPVDILAKGAYAPDFTLNDINGNLIDISGWLGRTPIVLAFWSIYGDSSVDEMLALQKLENRYSGQDLIILAVNEDGKVPPERISRFLERLDKYSGKITYPIFHDAESSVLTDFKIMYLPTLVVIDRDGRIADYFHGFDIESERDLLSSIEKTVASNKAEEATQPVSIQHGVIITVTGEAALCGFYESGTWRKGFTGSNDLRQEVALTRDVARRDASRRSIISALKMLGITLYSNSPRLDCLDGSGIHLARDPIETSDPLSNLITRLNYQELFETVSTQEKLLDTMYYSTRTVRVLTDRLSDRLESLGYTYEPVSIDLTYVNTGPLDRKMLLASLLRQSMFIGRLKNTVMTPHLTSQVLEIYTAPSNFFNEITSMDFGDMNVFIERMTDTSLELEVW